eukprot:jgi/Tetstr1/457113/TSEL_043763.t1
MNPSQPVGSVKYSGKGKGAAPGKLKKKQPMSRSRLGGTTRNRSNNMPRLSGTHDPDNELSIGLISDPPPRLARFQGRTTAQEETARRRTPGRPGSQRGPGGACLRATDDSIEEPSALNQDHVE